MRWLDHLSSEHRTRLLSVVGAVVLVILCGSATAVWLYPGHKPSLATDDRSRLGTGAQPGSSPDPSGTPTGSPPDVPGTVTSTTRASSPATAPTATYKTITLLGLVGFDTEVGVADPASSAWTVVLVMPDDTPVENRSPMVVKLVQQGTKVTLTPIGSSGTKATFTVRFPKLLALGKSVTSCTINGEPCKGI
jgi:hypothetical protein